MRILISVLLALALSGCGALGYKKPEFNLVDIKPGKATLFEQNFEATFRLQNPNDKALSAKGMSFTLSVAGEKLATGVSSQAITVPALGETLVKLQLHSTLFAWIKSAGKAIDQADGKLPYEISGTLESLNGWGSVPFKSQGEWKLPR